MRKALPALLAVAACALPVLAGVSPSAQKFIDDIAARAAEAEKAGKSVIVGTDGWLFFAPELRSMSVGRFWGDAAARVSKATSPEYADPIPAIVDFKKQLDKARVSLIVVPVPAKCAVYPERVPGADASLGGTRVDPYHQEFYAVLKAQGVNVLDPTVAFIKARSAAGGPLYCKQDTHWSGRACSLTASLIAPEIRKQPWFKAVAKKRYVKETRQVTLKGDLLEALGDPSVKPESVTLTPVKEKTASGAVPVADWPKSPVLLLGDSHNLIFHSGDDMQAHGAGLADHLAAELGFPVDVVAVRGSGATPARLNLMRRRDNMAGKKVVIWCFSVREFTEGQGWRKVPIVK